MPLQNRVDPFGDIHAVDARGNHEVCNFRCQGEIRYWLWEDPMPEPELRTAKTA